MHIFVASIYSDATTSFMHDGDSMHLLKNFFCNLNPVTLKLAKEEELSIRYMKHLC